jgi:hypothetical protein
MQPYRLASLPLSVSLQVWCIPEVLGRKSLHAVQRPCTTPLLHRVVRMITPRTIRLARLASVIYSAFSRVAHALPTRPEDASTFVANTSPTTSHHPSEGSPASEQAFWFHVSLSAALVLLGGIFAGLTIGLMGLDELHLKVLAASSGSTTERISAMKVLALLQGNRHWVLVVSSLAPSIRSFTNLFKVLLLCNVVRIFQCMYMTSSRI